MTTLLPLKTQQAEPATQKNKTTNTDVWNGSAQEGGRAQNYREQRGAPTSKRRGASWGSGARLESPPGVSMGRVFLRQVQLGGDPEADPALGETPQCSAGPLPRYLLQPPEEVAGGVGERSGLRPRREEEEEALTEWNSFKAG